MFGVLSRAEQYTQLKISMGERQFQAAEPEPAETQATSLRVFHQLKPLSKQHEPGYIEAFRQDFHTDWRRTSTTRRCSSSRRPSIARVSRTREQQRRRADGQGGREAPAVARGGPGRPGRAEVADGAVELPDEGLEAFLELLKQTVNGLGASDPELLDLVMPYREHVSGGNGLRALRRNLDRIRDEAAHEVEPDALKAQFEDLLTATHGHRALMVGGSVREDVRKTLQRLFDLEHLRLGALRRLGRQAASLARAAGAGTGGSTSSSSCGASSATRSATD